MPLTIGEKIFISAFRKLNIFKSKTKQIYEKELKRVLPNIQIGKIKNYTEDKRFKDLEKLFNKEK